MTNTKLNNRFFHGTLSEMNFSQYLSISASEIEEHIQKYLLDWQQNINLISPKLIPLTEIFTAAWQGGKRIRGALVGLGYHMAGGQDNPSIYPIAVAYEIFQTSILAHDDIIDLSPTRRGKPTVYRQLGGDHYGISQTICLGDIGFFLANKLIVDSKFPAEVKINALDHFSRMVINTGLGEMLDIELPHLQKKRTEEDVVAIQRLKTADYTISYPLIIGAVLAGADQEYLNNLKQFGDYLGIAFQIQDDILGVFGDEETLGKSVTSDIEEGKNTLLITYALEHGDKKQVKILNQYYGSGKITSEDIEVIKQIFSDTGALEYSQQKAVEYVSLAKKMIPQITTDKEYQQLLEEMADFLVQRTR